MELLCAWNGCYSLVTVVILTHICGILAAVLMSMLMRNVAAESDVHVGPFRASCDTVGRGARQTAFT